MRNRTNKWWNDLCMARQTALACAAMVLTLCSSCGSHYRLTGVERTRILVNQAYDARTDADAATFLAPYKQQVDSVMSPVVGRCAHYMAATRPESGLSNLLADILVWASPQYGEKVDMAVYNIGGMRAAFPEGDVTYGDVLDVAPFENKICFLTLTGEELMELFGQISMVHGEGVSHGVELVATKEGRLLSVRLNGEEIDAGRNYRLVTLDYLAQGNDKLEAFKKGKDVVSPQEVSNNVRFLIMDYFREQARQGHEVNSLVEGRIVLK